MSMLDQWIVMVWGIAILGIGISAGLRSSALSFWINNRQTHLFLLISTIVATQVGGGTIFGIASSTRQAGTGYGLVATISIVLGFIIISFMAKRIFAVVGRREAFTMPEIIGIRHGRTAQMVAGFVVVMAYLSVLGVQILAVGLIVQMWSGASFNTALVLAGAGVVLYSAFAGLKGDIVTDVAHVIMLILVLFVLFPWFLCKQVNVGEILLHLPSEAFSPIRFGGYTYLVAGAIIGIMLPLVSMEQWMRIYAAENQRSASLAYFVSAIVILPFLFDADGDRINFASYPTRSVNTRCSLFTFHVCLLTSRCSGYWGSSIVCRFDQYGQYTYRCFVSCDLSRYMGEEASHPLMHSGLVEF